MTPQELQWPLHTCTNLDSPEECAACALEAIADRPQELVYDWEPLECET